MPCRIPNGEMPCMCDKKAERSINSPDGIDHCWPQEGHMYIARCEVYCQFCFVDKGKTGRWKFPWHLRRHVINVHAGRTHPNLTCSEGWSGAEDGNKKPWRENNTEAPMGRRASIPDRQRRRRAQKKKKRASRMTTPEPAETTSEPVDTTLQTSPSSWTIEGTADTTLAGQQYLPNGFQDAAWFFPELINNDQFGDAFGHDAVSFNSSGTFGGQINNDASQTADKYDPDAHLSFGYHTNDLFPELHGVDGKIMSNESGFEGYETEEAASAAAVNHFEQILRTEGTIIQPDPTPPVGCAARDVVEVLNDKLFHLLIEDKITERQTLWILQEYTSRFQMGKK